MELVGGRVVEACNGVEGLEAAREQHPDLILLDLVMPVMDGWETIHCLKTNVRTRWIPVVAFTAYHQEWQRLREAGFRGYLEKPVPPFRLLEEVERIAGRLDWRNPPRAGRVSGADSGRSGHAPAHRWSAPRSGPEPSPTGVTAGEGSDAVRIFRDGSGTEWHVCVVASDRRSRVERRRAERRRLFAGSYTGPERRRGTDRRVNDRRATERRAAPGRSGAWLRFRSALEERRLDAVPPDWESCSEARLALLCSLSRTS
jgi:CheY-like chemotaxis protein